MIPPLQGIDHVHVYVPDRAAAARWYAEVLGFEPLEAFRVWATPDGPLTLEDRSGNVHIALFESHKGPTSTIAFRVDAAGFTAWKTHLEQAGLELRVSDHELAWSLYFSDPWGNLHEITTYDHAAVAEALG